MSVSSNYASDSIDTGRNSPRENVLPPVLEDLILVQ